jgi:beta-glucosidase
MVEESKVTKRLNIVVLLAIVCQTVVLSGLSFNSTIGRANATPYRTVEDPVADELADSQAFFGKASQTSPARDTTAAAEAILVQMTLEEKVGQMTQLEIGMIARGRGQSLQIDPVKLEKAVVKYGVGSILNVADEALPVEKWHDIIRQIQEAAAKTRLHIPVIYGIDTIHGANYILGSTLFPQEIGMAATWNPMLMSRTSEIAAMETRAAGIPWNFSPVLDLGRQPLWPRFYETFGEDPYLAKVMGVATVRGYEGNNVAATERVASCLKHYVGYSVPLSGRDRSAALIPETYLREYLTPTFQAAVAAGARSVMVNSGEVNGVPGHANRYLLNDVLRNEFGFRGLVVSDWEDIRKMASTHKIAATEKEATRIGIMAGIDMSMVPSSYSFSDNLIALVKEGAVPMSRIDEAVRRILRLKLELGLFESPVPDPPLKSRVGLAQSRSVCLQAARESLTLLKNGNNVLPLSKDRKVLVTGPTADSLISLNNGWTYTWQGDNKNIYPKDRLTVLGAIEAKVGKQNVKYVAGASLDKELDVPAAVNAARDSDIAVVCLGEGSYAETPGNIEDLSLSDAQLNLAAAVAATGKPVVLVLIEGRPRIINKIADNASAILMAYNPGNEGGQAIADVLFGDYNPSGKLPFTYPRHPNALIAYDHKQWELNETAFGNSKTGPQFEFGFGLSYTTFEYADLRVEPKNVDASGKVAVSVVVKNTGLKPGKEVVQLYVRDVVASITPAGKRLRRFAKIYLEPGQSKTLRFALDRDDLSFIGPDNRSIVEPGEFDVMIGGLGDKFVLSSGPNRQ